MHVRVRPAVRRIGSRLLLPDWLAITIDTTVVTWRRLDDRELAHELEHVRQWQRLGRTCFVVHYAIASFRAWRGGGHWYRDNAFEREAREAAADRAMPRRMRTAAHSRHAGSPRGPRPHTPQATRNGGRTRCSSRTASVPGTLRG